MMGRFGQCNGPFWTIFLEIKIFGAVLAMGRFGIDPSRQSVCRLCVVSSCLALHCSDIFLHFFSVIAAATGMVFNL